MSSLGPPETFIKPCLEPSLPTFSPDGWGPAVPDAAACRATRADAVQVPDQFLGIRVFWGEVGVGLVFFSSESIPRILSFFPAPES